MKIGLLSFEYPPETGFGGIGTYTWYQARALAKLGHEVHVLAGATGETELTTSGHDGVTVHRFRSGGLRGKQHRNHPFTPQSLVSGDIFVWYWII